MDDLLQEFLAETNEGLGELDNELVRLETEPDDVELLSGIFRTVHTIKGTCGFIGLPRLESLAHAAENVLGRFRDRELSVTPERVTLIFAALDGIKNILHFLESNGAEPDGDDAALIERLEAVAALESDDAEPAPVAADVDSMEFDTVDDDQGAPNGGAPNGGAPNGDAEAEDAVDWGIEAEADDAGAEKDDDAVEVAAMDGADGMAAALDAATNVTPLRPAGESASASATKTDGPAGGETTGGGAAAQTIRVSVDLLENLMTMVSELVLTRNQLTQMARLEAGNDLAVPMQRLSQVTSELQEGVMKTRMQPIGNAWSKLPRLVRDLNTELGKKVELEMTGAETELDRQVLDMIKDPLTHMVRNSLDHGVEMPQDRVAKGKPEKGKLLLNAFHEGGHILIEIRDDGKGLDASALKAKAVSRGLISEAEAQDLTEQQAFQLIFRAGFSTAEKVTAVSGRGVGMDVVRTNVDKIGGTIEVSSRLGQGTTFTIKIPLTLAIVSALIVAAGGERFAIPQINVVELVRVSQKSEHRIERIRGTPVLRLRENLLPLVSLRGHLDLPVGGGQEDFVIVTQVGSNRFGLLVDSVFDTEEIVVKPVAPMLRDLTAFSGNTILGDGSVIMILDPNGIAQSVGDIGQSDLALAEDADGMRDFREKTRFILFEVDRRRCAVPLSLVARIEQIDMQTIESAAGQPVVQYRDALMPLTSVGDGAIVQDEGRRPVLVFQDEKRNLGLVVHRILDIVETDVEIETVGSITGVLGNAVIDGRATDVIDIDHYIKRVGSDWFGVNAERRGDRQVLMVDDSRFFLDLARPLLKAAGYKVTAVDSAERALDLCEQGRSFDVIVTDIEMPRINGFDFAQRLKGTRWSQIPVIALSSRVGERDLARGHDCGFADYVVKFDRESLLHALEDVAA